METYDHKFGLAFHVGELPPESVLSDDRDYRRTLRRMRTKRDDPYRLSLAQQARARILNAIEDGDHEECDGIITLY